MSKSANRVLDGQVLVRLPASVAARIAALAEAEGITGASWSRHHLVAAAAADPSDAVRLRARAIPGTVTPGSILEMARLREVVAELSGSMKIAAVDTRLQGHPILHAEIEALIPGIKGAVLDLDNLKRAIMSGSLP